MYAVPAGSHRQRRSHTQPVSPHPLPSQKHPHRSQVVSVMVTAGIDMRNASIYIGSNSTSVFGNTLVAVSCAAHWA